MTLEEYRLYLQQLATKRKETIVTIVKKIIPKTRKLISKTFKPNTKK